MSKTDKLYYEDPYLETWSAKITQAKQDMKVFLVSLSQTCFYPEGGGQPGDRGLINNCEVLNTIKDENEDIVHICKNDPGTGNAECRLDWTHRWDYMQQHAGQHILSAVLKQELDINTVSVHQGEEYTAVETDSEEISDEEIAMINKKANELILENIEIKTRVIDSSEIDKYPLRRPTTRTGKIRLVELGDYDRVACGGVHTARSGEVRLILVYAVEKIQGRCRILAKIGDRVLGDYHLKTGICLGLVDDLSVPLEQITTRYEQEKELVKSLHAKTAKLEMQLADALFESVSSESLTHSKSGKQIVFRSHKFMGQSPDVMKEVAKKMLDETDNVFFIANQQEEKLMWQLGCSGITGFDFNELKEALFSALQGKGGGRYPLWQGFGSGPDAFDSACRVISDYLRS